MKPKAKIASRDITQLLALSGIPEEKMTFLFQTPYGDVHVKYGYISSNNGRANAYLIQTLRRPGVKIDVSAMEKQEKGFINSLKSIFKKK